MSSVPVPCPLRGTRKSQAGRAANPCSSTQGGQEAVGMQGGEHTMHRERGLSPSASRSDGISPTLPATSPQTRMDPLGKELGAARGDHSNPARGISAFEAKRMRRHFEMWNNLVGNDPEDQTITSNPLSQAAHPPLWTPPLSSEGSCW